MQHHNLSSKPGVLVKDFGRTRAVDGLNLSVAAGEIHGFLGPTVPVNPPPGEFSWD